MDATRSSATCTAAEPTRCTTARITRPLFEHPGVVAPHDRLDLARRQVPGGVDGHALLEGHARDVGDLPEAVPVLEQEGLPVDLDELSSIRGRRGHALSMRKARRYAGPG